jgi:hypothetical protein
MLPLRAALLAYEPFDYPDGTPLLQQTNGLGFTSNWIPGGFNASIHEVFRIKAGAMKYPGLATQGTNHASAEAVVGPGIAGLSRILSTNLTTPGATYYLSFLHRPDAPEEYASVVIGTGELRELSIGKSGSVKQYHVSQRGGVNRVLSDVEPIVGKTAFLVVKMEITEGPDRFTLFVNPVPGKPEPQNGFVKEDFDLEIADQVILYSRSAWSVDEIRIGTTWADVTPAAR